jgi:hypothetical protein
MELVFRFFEFLTFAAGVCSKNVFFACFSTLAIYTGFKMAAIPVLIFEWIGNIEIHMNNFGFWLWDNYRRSNDFLKKTRFFQPRFKG